MRVPIIYPTFNFNFLEQDGSFRKHFEEKSNTDKVSQFPIRKSFKSNARKQKKGNKK